MRDESVVAAHVEAPGNGASQPEARLKKSEQTAPRSPVRKQSVGPAMVGEVTSRQLSLGLGPLPEDGGAGHGPVEHGPPPPSGRGEKFQWVELSRIRLAGTSSRLQAEPETLTALVKSIAQHGLLEPLRLRPRDGGHYEVTVGKRRFLAAQRAGLRRVPAVVAVADDRRAFEASVVENLEREDLGLIDRCHMVQRMNVTPGLHGGWQGVAEQMGLSRIHVYRLRQVEALPAEMLQAAEQGALNEKHVRALVSLGADVGAQQRLWQAIRRRSLSGNEALREADRVRGQAATLAKRLDGACGRLAGLLGQLDAATLTGQEVAGARASLDGLARQITAWLAEHGGPPHSIGELS